MPRPASTPSLALAVALAAGGCGRTPPWLPCGGAPTDDEVPSVSCADASCGGAPAIHLPPRSASALVLLDRSCSMAEHIEGRNKWSRAVEAVVGMVTDPRARDVQWGLSLFPDGDTDPTQGPLVVPVAPDGADVIAALLTQALDREDPLHPQQPSEPCYTDLDPATTQVATGDVFAGLSGAHRVVLITDGLASNGYVAVENLRELHEREIPTFVVGFGERVDEDVLERLAAAGGVPASGSTGYYRAGLDDLGGALQDVLQGLRCRYPVSVPEEDLPRLEVHIAGGSVVPRDRGDGEGWRYDAEAEELVIAGTACDALSLGTAAGLELALACDDA